MIKKKKKKKKTWIAQRIRIQNEKTKLSIVTSDFPMTINGLNLTKLV